MYELGIVKRNIVRADKAAVEKLGRFGVATFGSDSQFGSLRGSQHH